MGKLMAIIRWEKNCYLKIKNFHIKIIYLLFLVVLLANTCVHTYAGIIVAWANYCGSGKLFKSKFNVYLTKHYLCRLIMPSPISECVYICICLWSIYRRKLNMKKQKKKNKSIVISINLYINMYLFDLNILSSDLQLLYFCKSINSILPNVPYSVNYLHKSIHSVAIANWYSIRCHTASNIRLYPLMLGYCNCCYIFVCFHCIY